MQTVFETRKIRLGMLKQKYLRWSIMNEAIGWDKTSARLSQIFNETQRKDRGTPYVMGDDVARMIEERLQLEVGWMDTPPTYAELAGESDPRAKVVLAMENMTAEEVYQLQRFVDAVAKPAKNGTHGG